MAKKKLAKLKVAQQAIKLYVHLPIASDLCLGWPCSPVDAASLTAVWRSGIVRWIRKRQHAKAVIEGYVCMFGHGKPTLILVH
jgi:hypothetical protein